MKPQEELYGLIKSSFMKLDERDFVTLMDIDDHLRNGSINALARALEIAVSNQMLLTMSTVSLQERLRFSMERNPYSGGRETGRGR